MLRDIVLEWVVPSARVAVGALLTLSSLGKLVSPRAFEKAVVEFKLVPSGLTKGFAYGVPICELGVGFALLGRFFAAPAGLAAALLFLVFGAALAIALIRGFRDLSCNCFGAGHGTISWHSVFRNLGFAGLAILSTGRYIKLSGALISLYAASLLLDALIHWRKIRTRTSDPTQVLLSGSAETGT